VNDLRGERDVRLEMIAMRRMTDLTDDVLVGESDNQSILWRVVLVLGLSNQSLSSVVVGFSLCCRQQEREQGTSQGRSEWYKEGDE
jgi:hypothetical protein